METSTLRCAATGGGSLPRGVALGAWWPIVYGFPRFQAGQRRRKSGASSSAECSGERGGTLPKPVSTATITGGHMFISLNWA